MKKLLIAILMLWNPLSACGSLNKEEASQAKATSVNVVAQTFAPPASVFRFLDNVIGKVLKLNPGSDTVSMRDLEAIDVADLQASAQEARLDLSKLESLTNYLSPKTKSKISNYFRSQHPDMGTRFETKTLKKADISAAYDTFKNFFGMPASELQNIKAELETKDLIDTNSGAGEMNFMGIDAIIGSAVALGFLVCYVIPAIIVLIIASVILSPIIYPLFALLELLILFAISFGGMI